MLQISDFQNHDETEICVGDVDSLDTNAIDFG